MRAHRPDRRSRARARTVQGFMTAIVCGLILLMGFHEHALAVAKPRLFVFVSTPLKPVALQRTMQEQLPRAEITVYGRFRDFRDAVAHEAPDAVIAQRLVLEALGVQPQVQGVAKGQSDESYAILAIDKALSPADLVGKTVGTVDLLGRRKTRGFVGSLLGLPEAPKVTTVSKTEDLLALLQFQDADAVVIPTRQIEFLQSKTQQKLVVSPLPNKVSLPAGAFLTDGGQTIAASITALANPEIGVEQWQ